MILKIGRKIFTNTSTIGRLYVDGSFECWTIEDVVRALGPKGEGKVMGQTAIPYGIYEVTIDKSERFQRLMPHILNVPFFTGIRIHSGNTAADTAGCPCLGQAIGEDMLYRSGPAFDAFFPKLVVGVNEGKVYIDITKEF